MIGGRGRATELVGDHRELVALTRQSQHRLQEILAVDAVYPRGAKDEVVRLRLAHARFAFGLGAAIDGERRDRIVLDIGAGFLAVENVVGGEVHERHAGVGTGSGEDGGPFDIGSARELGLVLGAIDRCVGGGIDDKSSGRCRSIASAYGFGMGNVGLSERQADGGDLALACEGEQLGPGLSIGAEDEDRRGHTVSPSRSPR